MLVNVNPNAPRFERSSYTVTINETVVPGTVIQTVLATDPDGVSRLYITNDPGTQDCVCLFELMLYVPVNSCHVGTLSPFYGTFTQNENVMTSTSASNITIQLSYIRLIRTNGFT